MSRLVTYRCSNCKQLTSFPDNPAGFSTLGSCNITKNCNGELLAISNKLSNVNPMARSIQNDLVAWYPRRCLHKHTQSIARKEWVIEHQLDVQPLVVVYDSDGKQYNDCVVKYSDRSTVIITFASAISGSAHLITRTSQSDYDIASVQSTAPDVAIDARGVLTIATLTPTTQTITGTLRFYRQVTNSLLLSVPVTFTFGDHVPNASWYDYNYVRFDGRRYNVRQTHLDLQSIAFTDPTYFRFTLNTQSDTVFLLTDKPYSITDVNLDSVTPYAFVESADGGEETVYSNNQLLVVNRFVEKVVARIVKVG